MQARRARAAVARRGLDPAGEFGASLSGHCGIMLARKPGPDSEMKFKPPGQACDERKQQKGWVSIQFLLGSLRTLRTLVVPVG